MEGQSRMEKKYINALNALGNCTFCKKRNTCTDRRGRHLYCWEIDEKFTVDVVEVVRCEKCKHYDYERDVCHNPRFGDGHANYPPPYVREDFFCADGERKESEGGA